MVLQAESEKDESWPVASPRPSQCTLPVLNTRKGFGRVLELSGAVAEPFGRHSQHVERRRVQVGQRGPTGITDEGTAGDNCFRNTHSVGGTS